MKNHANRRRSVSSRTFIAMLIYAVIAFAVSVLTGKSTRLRKIVNGKPIILFDKGKLYRDNFRKARIDLSDFLTHCRNQGYFDLSQVQTAVFEYNGSISILPVDDYRPLEPSDMNIKPAQQQILVNIILDGKVNEENLKHTGNNNVWLDKQLHTQGYHSAKTVDNTLTLYAADVGKKTADPFE